MQKPSNQKFKEVFDGIATQYDRISNKYLVSARKEFFGNWAKGKCLEIGAGTGQISKFLSEKHQVVATDISPRMVEEIKKCGIESCVCDAENLPFENNSFDTVIAAEVVFYLDYPEKFFSEAYRVLRPEGRLLISCADNFPVKIYDKLRSCLRVLGFKKGMYFDEDTLGEFMTLPKLKEMLGYSNFSIVSVKKAPVLPFSAFDSLNKLFEKTPLIKNFGIFIFTCAQK